MENKRLNKINEIMGLDREEKKVVQFHVKHLWLMRLPKHEKKYFQLIPGYEDYLKRNTADNMAYTAFVERRPVVCFGLISILPGVAEAWLVPSLELRKSLRIYLPFHRATKKFFEHAFDIFNLRRIQVSVDENNVQALKWIKSMLFVREGCLREFGPDGSNHIVYSRIRSD